MQHRPRVHYGEDRALTAADFIYRGAVSDQFSAALDAAEDGAGRVFQSIHAAG